jgi:hypothetical protein
MTLCTAMTTGPHMNYTDVYREIQEGTAGGRLAARVTQVMMETAQGTRPMTAIRHPLGFICLPVARHDEHGICIHMWTGRPAKPQLTTSPIHSHSWDLFSYVLYGEVRNQLMQVTDAPATPSHRVFEVHNDGDIDEIRYTARLVHCAPGSEQPIAAGNFYRVAAGEFHMTVVATQAATVVLGRGRTDMIDLSLGGLTTPTHRVRRQRCAQQETMRLARALANRMSESSVRSG